MEHLQWININFRYFFRKFGTNDKKVFLYNFLKSLYFYYLHAYFILMLLILDEMFNCHLIKEEIKTMQQGVSLPPLLGTLYFHNRKNTIQVCFYYRYQTQMHYALKLHCTRSHQCKQTTQEPFILMTLHSYITVSMERGLVSQNRWKEISLSRDF